MNRVRYPAAAAGFVGAALLLTACANVTPGHGAPAGAAGAGGGATGAPVSGSSATNGPTLAALLSQSLAQTSSLHLDLSVSVAGQQITASGDESISGGKLTAMDVTEALPGFGSVELRVIGTQVYAKLPGIESSGKPWLLADATSSNPLARTLGTTTGSLLSQSSLSSYSALAQAATTVTDDGPATIDGQATTHYSIVVDVAKLPPGNPASTTLGAAGIATLPLEAWLDSQNRLVQLTEDLTVGGQDASTKITVSNYDQPVSIAAPPADQVSH